MIGKIQRQLIRTVWEHGERDFSRWLREGDVGLACRMYMFKAPQ